MKVRRVERIDGAWLFEPTPIVDERGFFSRTFDAELAREVGIDPNGFAQDSVSRSALVWCGVSTSGVAPASRNLVRCSYGAVYDVIVDLRPDSPTYRNWESFVLNGDEQVSLYIPRGCAHGFQALTRVADVSIIDRAYDPSEDIAICFDSPALAIPWPLPPGILSRRDQHALSLEDAVRALGTGARRIHVSRFDGASS